MPNTKNRSTVKRAVRRLERVHSMLIERGDVDEAMALLDKQAAIQLTLPAWASDAHARIIGHIRNAVAERERPYVRDPQMQRAREWLTELRRTLE